MTESGKLDQRFYTSQFGRFMSADRFKQAAKTNDSGSWNKYAYANRDPVNLFDPTGLTACGDLAVEGTGQTVAQEVNANTAQGHFIDLVWHEAGTFSQAGGNLAAWTGGFEGIAQAIWDRYQLVSGNASVTGANGVVYGGANVKDCQFSLFSRNVQFFDAFFSIQ
jgi:RHS repeat-associated protein